MLEHSENRQRPVVVGIGASAGGLEALIRTLREVPQNPLLSYVIVQHPDPTHESALSEILSRKTSLKFLEATDGTALRTETSVSSSRASIWRSMIPFSNCVSRLSPARVSANQFLMRQASKILKGIQKETLK